MQGCRGDRRVRIVIHDAAGPTCKADCLNRLYRALQVDEAREGAAARMVVLHDAEDLIDPAALPLLDAAVTHADFVQLPVLALPQAASPLVSGHYADEFAEAHAKAMVVRSALGQGIPGAGVGCAIARSMLDKLDRKRGGAGPFAAGSLTKDYELGRSDHPLQAHPLPFLQFLSLAMQLLPHALPAEHTLQQPLEAQIGPAAGIIEARESAIPARRIFM
jgi:adsorption protein B